MTETTSRNSTLSPKFGSRRQPLRKSGATRIAVRTSPRIRVIRILPVAGKTNIPGEDDRDASVDCDQILDGKPHGRYPIPARARADRPNSSSAATPEGRTKVRLIKMFGLVAVPVVVAMAFVGVSWAVAESTMLCENDTAVEAPTAEECKSPELVHFLSVSLNEKKEYVDAKAKLLSSLATVECNALILAHSTSVVLPPENKSGAFLPTTYAGLLTYENCNCTVKVLQQGAISVLRLGEVSKEEVDVTAAGYAVKVECFGLFTCDYNAENLVGEGKGGLTVTEGESGLAYVTSTAVNLLHDLESLFGSCPSETETKLDALFKSLKPLYIRS